MHRPQIGQGGNPCPPYVLQLGGYETRLIENNAEVSMFQGVSQASSLSSRVPQKCLKTRFESGLACEEGLADHPLSAAENPISRHLGNPR
jgi:hypothetical protein